MRDVNMPSTDGRSGMPLLSGQAGLWVAQKLDPTGTLFQLRRYTEIRGSIDEPILIEAMKTVVAEAEAMRLWFEETENGPRQHIDPLYDWAPSFHDVSEAEDPRDAALALMDRVSWQPFDLTRPPLFRWGLIKLGNDHYYMLQCCHHLLMDGAAANVLLKRLADVYGALLMGRDVPQPDTIPMAGLVADQTRYRQSPRWGKDRDYWLGRLRGRPGPAHLARPSTPLPVPFRRHVTAISADQVDALQCQAARLKSSLFALIVAAVAIYYARMTGQRDLLLSVPVMARSGAKARHTIALMSNIIMLRLTVTPGTTLARLADQVGMDFRAGLRHQHFPLEDLRRALDLSPTDGDLTWVAVNYMPFDYGFRLGEIPIETHNLSNGPVPGSSIAIYEGAPGKPIVLHWDGNETLFSDADLARHAGRLLRVLRHIAVVDPDTPIADITFLEADERHRVLRGFNASDHPEFDLRVTLAGLFEAGVYRDPSRPALLTVDETITFGSLDKRANRLAHLLRRHGIGPEQIVGIVLQRSVEFVAAILAIVKSGAAYVPLDPQHPPYRLMGMLDDCQAAALITTTVLAGNLGQGGEPNRFRRAVIRVDDPETQSTLGQMPATPLSDGERTSPIVPGNLAHVIYTSGSTGRQKGVAGTNRAVLNRLKWMWDTYPFDTNDRGYLKTAVGFVDAVWELLGFLMAGRPLAIALESEATDPAAFLDRIRRDRVTRIAMVPSLLHKLLDEGEGADAPLGGLRLLVSGGEALPAALRDRVARRAPDLTFLNIYGSTEVMADASFHHCRFGEQGSPIGRPLGNVRLYILDSGLNPVPIGVAGTLYVAGAGLARGYLRQPGLTADRFIACPFGSPGERMYNTGDVAQWRDDGSVDYLGRIDAQVSIRGVRIEPAEIEAALLNLNGVARAVVLPRPHGQDSVRLVAWVVPKDGLVLDPAALRQALADRLPTYFIPAAIVPLDRLPLNTNGKVDKSALPDPDVPETACVVAPFTEIEARLCILFGEVVGVEQIGIDHDFFAIGGESLSALRLIGRIRAETGREISLRIVFENPTPRALAAFLEAPFRGDGYSPLLPLRRAGDEQPLFCVHPASGLATCYGPLAGYLSRDVPIWGLQARGVETGEAPHGSLEEMASVYVDAMRTVQPSGPYRILGWSLGGRIAQEMACQLDRPGDRGSQVILIDTPTGLPSESGIGPVAVDKMKLLQVLAEQLGVDPTSLPDDYDKAVAEVLRQATLNGVLPVGAGADMLQRIADNMYRAAPLTEAHSLKRCQASILEIRATGEVDAVSQSLIFEWDRFTTGTVTTVFVRSGHEQILHPAPAQEIAGHLMRYWERDAMS